MAGEGSLPHVELLVQANEHLGSLGRAGGSWAAEVARKRVTNFYFRANITPPLTRNHPADQ
jgi:hypothetical protein